MKQGCDEVKAQEGGLFTKDGVDIWRLVTVEEVMVATFKNLETAEVKVRRVPLMDFYCIVMPKVYPPSGVAGLPKVGDNNREGSQARLVGHRPSPEEEKRRTLAARARPGALSKPALAPPADRKPYKGVTWDGIKNRSNPWRAQVNRPGCSWSKNFKTPEEALAAREAFLADHRRKTFTRQGGKDNRPLPAEASAKAGPKTKDQRP